MKKLTDFQKEFLLNTFFKDERFAGWRTIATKLLEKGKSTVAGDTCIWQGGIGNFIETKTSEDAIGCLLYEFDLDKFLSSAFYKEIADIHMAEIYERKRQAEKEYFDLFSL